MQMEMEAGGLLFFDLFVAICNHMVRTSLCTHTPVTFMTLCLFSLHDLLHRARLMTLLSAHFSQGEIG